MAPTRKNLAAALKAESGLADRSAPTLEVAEAAPTRKPASAIASGIPPNYVPPSRKGKKVISGYFDPEVSKQLKLICLEEDLNVQAALQEALNDLFVKYGKSPIA
jgi:hypothetical protein